MQPVLDAVAARAARAPPASRVEEFGEASADHALNETIDKDFSKRGAAVVPLTFLILLLAFGAFVAAGVPVLLAFSAVLGSVGLSALVSHVAPRLRRDELGDPADRHGGRRGLLALLRQARARGARAGHDGRDALHRAAATSGQAVLISGVTVLIAMAGMLFAGIEDLHLARHRRDDRRVHVDDRLADRAAGAARASSATGSTAACSPCSPPACASCVRPLGAAAARAAADAAHAAAALKGDRQESRIWAPMLRPSLRFPAAAAALSAALLVVLALPAFGMHTEAAGFNDLPTSLQIVQTYDRIQKAFPGSPSPGDRRRQAPTTSRRPQAKAAIADLRSAGARVGRDEGADPHRRSTATHTVAQVDIPLVGNGERRRVGRSARRCCAAGRARRRSAARTAPQYAVTGETAGNADFNATSSSRAPIVFAFVLGLAFLLLLLTFRSIVIPIKAIVLNLLSVGAAYGVLVWIFQQGHLQGLLGFHSNGAVVTWLPLFLFTVLFGLSMDYHVFILSRIKELVDRGVPTEEAVERGIRTTASTVTSAALVMVAVFAIFATLSTLDIKQMGVGLAVAVLLDATIIRGVLLPATMKLLGDWNWYLPRSCGGCRGSASSARPRTRRAGGLR